MNDAAIADRKLTAGILGGMGPQATVDLMRRVIALTPANDDCDHIRMLVDCDPSVPSRVAAILHGTGPSPAPALMYMARSLAAQGADFLAMPCNTAHYYHAEIASAVSVPVIDMLANAAARIHALKPQLTQVGLLASSAVEITGIYQPHLTTLGKRALYPAPPQQARLMRLIGDIKSSHRHYTTAPLVDSAQALIDGGAQCLLIACTELSVIADALDAAPVPVFDAADLLARDIIDRALQRR